MPRLTFLGAAGTVSGSRHLLESNGGRVLFDCGLFQGERALRRRNWQPLGVPPGQLDAVVLTHGHIDHSGWLPRLVREGFRGVIHATPATADLLDLLLYDLVTSQRPAPAGKDLPITLIGLYESDIQSYGWPIEDGLLCRAIERLGQEGAVAIGLDLYRDKGMGPNQACQLNAPSQG